MREACAQWLTLAGFTVVPCASASAALERLGCDFPGILVTDVRMPEVDGLELLARCRKRDPDLPVVMMTGHGDVAMAVQAMRAGAYDFLEKPFPPGDDDRHRPAGAGKARPGAGESPAARPPWPAGRDGGVAPRPQPGHGRAARNHRRAGRHQRQRPGARRDWGRQGAGRPLPAPRRAPRRQAAGGPELRRAPREPLRGRALRQRGGGLHRRRQAAHRQVGARRRRHPVPRRDREHAPQPPSQAVAGPPGAQHRAPRRQPADPRRFPHRGGDQGRPAGGEPRRHLPRGPLLPAQCRRDPHPPPARTARGHPPALHPLLPGGGRRLRTRGACPAPRTSPPCSPTTGRGTCGN